MKPRFRNHYVLASLFTLGLIAAVLLWVVDSRLSEFRANQVAMAENSVTELAKQVDRKLQEKKRLAALFRDNEMETIRGLVADPKNDVLRARLDARVRAYFPDSFSVTLGDEHGEVLLDEFEGFVDGMCLQDIRDMAERGAYRIRIHPNNHGYHYDIMAPLPMDDGAGVLFISFKPVSLGRLIHSVQLLGHELLLAKFDGDPLIEVTANGSRDTLERDDFRLQPSELQRILASAEVPGTAWRVLDLAAPGLFATYAANIWTQAGLVFIGFALTSLILMIGSVHIESKRSEATRALESANQELDLRVRQRTQELYERNLRLQSEIAARQEMQRENERLAVFPRDNPNPLLVCGPEGVPAYYNPAAEAAARDMRLADVDALLPPEHRDIVNSLASDGVHRLERAIDHHVYEYVYHAHLEQDLVFVYLGDVTERVAAEHRVRRSERFLRQVTSVLAEGLMVLDRNLHMYFMNPEAERLVGWSRDDLARNDVHDAIHEHHGDGVERDRCRIRRALIEGSVERVEDEAFFHRDGHSFPVSYTAAPMREGDEITGVVVAFQDVTERKEMENTLRFMATHDPLTGLYNRAELDRRFHDELNRAKRYRRQLSVLVMDIDHFKRVNDTFGHQAGDQVLCTFAAKLVQSIRHCDFAGRFGGEEFVVVLPETPEDQAVEFAERLRRDVQDAVYLENSGGIRLTVSIGVASYPERGHLEQVLFAAADQAAYQAKKEGRNRVMRAG